MKKLIGVIQPTGQMVNLYSDNSPLRKMGDVEVTRASNVEPDGRGGWCVQFSDDEQNRTWKNQWLYRYSTGELTTVTVHLLATSFATRQEALDAEVEFLTQKLEACA